MANWNRIIRRFISVIKGLLLHKGNPAPLSGRVVDSRPLPQSSYARPPASKLARFGLADRARGADGSTRIGRVDIILRMPVIRKSYHHGRETA
jgi:hypothetical protein